MSAHVLIVEDEDSIALALEFLLSEAGFEVTRAATGPAALEAAAARRPDLVLLDVMLPGRTGYDVCQALRADPAMAGVKIVILTAKGGAHEAEKSRELGADDFFEKPFSTRELMERVRALTGRGGGAPDAGPGAHPAPGPSLGMDADEGPGAAGPDDAYPAPNPDPNPAQRPGAGPGGDPGALKPGANGAAKPGAPDPGAAGPDPASPAPGPAAKAPEGAARDRAPDGPREGARAPRPSAGDG